MKNVIFGVVIASELLLLLSLVLTILLPQHRVWPPPRRASWRYYFTWVLTWTVVAGGIALGLLDWGTFVFDHWARHLIAGPVGLTGLALALWAVRTLGLHATQGLGGEFIYVGPYRFSRNPQYVGYIALILGYAIFCNSVLALVSGLLYALWFFVAPFAEEPWLQGRFGSKYDEYKRRVPRFVGLPHHDAGAE